MELHLILPGLLDPLKTWQQDYGWQPRSDALARLLDAMPSAPLDDDLHHYLLTAHLLGWEENSPAFAIFRAKGQQMVLPEEGDWVCADPIHLRTDANSAVVLGRERFDLRPDEAQELVSSLEETLGGDGWHFHYGTPGEWYLQTPRGAAPTGIPRDKIVGRDMRLLTRSSLGDRTWLARLTEIQMLLYRHPVNQAREARGELAINSLWCWGLGVENPSSGCGISKVLTDNSLIIGLAKAAAVANEPLLPETLKTPDNGQLLIVLEPLLAPAAYDDLSAWELALDRLDREWFGLLNTGLENGRYDCIHFYSEGRHWTIRRKGLLRRWLRSRPLSQLLEMT